MSEAALEPGSSRFRRRERVGTAILLAAGVATAALVGAIVWLIGVREFHRATAEWEARLTSLVTQRDEVITAWLAERRANVAIAAAYPLVRAALEDVDQRDQRVRAEHLSTVLEQMAQEYGYSQLAVHDRDGRVVLQTGDAVPSAAVIASARAAVATATFRVDHPDDPRGAWRLIFAGPVLAPADGGAAHVVGAVTLQMDPERSLVPLVTGEEVPTQSGETVLVERAGDDVIFLTPLRHASGKPAPRLPVASTRLAAASALAGEERFGEFIDYRGVPVLAAMRYIPITGWGLIAKVDRDEAFTNYRRDLWQTALAGVLVVLGFAGYVLAESRRQRARALAATLRAERAVLDARERFRLLSEYTQDIVLFLADDGRLLDANYAAQQAYGYRRDELLQRTIDEIRTSDPHDAIADLFGRAWRRGIVYEATHRRRDGSTFPVEVSAVGAEISGTHMMVEIIRDITERHRARAEIQQLNADLERRVAERTAELEVANRELESFNYSVSHDLRAPLRHIGGFADVLLDEHAAALSPEGRRCVQRIAAGSRRMTELIDALLQLSRVGRAAMQVRRVDLAALAHATFRDLRIGVGDRRIEFEVGRLPPVTGDPTLLRQLLENLIANAIKFTRPVEVARIEVGADVLDGVPFFYVRDNGVGFDGEYADKLFGVFQRLHSGEEFEGTGIGLSIVRRIAEKHGGRVWAENAPGGGATFYFTLGTA